MISIRSLLSRAALALAPALLAACGGIGLPEAVRTGGTGSPKVAVSAGPITGLGGLVVNGVRFDETGARVTINGVADRAVSELQLGMMVEVVGEVDAATRTGKASSVTATALLSGPAGAVDLARDEIIVLGQRVEVKPGTSLQGASSLASVRTGDAVVVYGFWDYFGGHVDATRLEVRPAAAAPPTTIIGRLSSVAGTRVQIGSLVVETAGAAIANLATGLAAGAHVEVRGVLEAGGVLRAATVSGRAEISPVEGALTEIEGYVADFAGLASFKVLGLPVNASAARVEGQAGALAAGALVEVEGQVVQGVLVATVVEVKAGVSQPAAPQPITLKGTISDFVSASSLRVLDQTVDASAAAFTGGTAANLANGRAVEVTGLVRGNVLLASAVAFTDPPQPEGSRLAVSGAITAFVSASNFVVNGQPVTTVPGTVYVGGGVADLGNGRLVTVDGMLNAGVLTATSVVFQPVAQPAAVTLTGVIADFLSATSFKVNNQPITTTGATAYREGTAAGLANGRRVTIEGALAAGVVAASTVTFSDPPPTAEDAEVEGIIQVFVSVSNFTVKGQVIDATNARYSNGRPADLARGLKVHVKGPVQQGVLLARTCEIDR